MILLSLFSGILFSMFIGHKSAKEPGLRRIVNILALLTLITVIAAMLVLVFGPPHFDRAEFPVQLLRGLSIGFLGYFADSTGLYPAIIGAASKLLGLKEEAAGAGGSRSDDAEHEEHEDHDGEEEDEQDDAGDDQRRN